MRKEKWNGNFVPCFFQSYMYRLFIANILFYSVFVHNQCVSISIYSICLCLYIGAKKMSMSMMLWYFGISFSWVLTLLLSSSSSSSLFFSIQILCSRFDCLFCYINDISQQFFKVSVFFLCAYAYFVGFAQFFCLLLLRYTNFNNKYQIF